MQQNQLREPPDIHRVTSDPHSQDLRGNETLVLMTCKRAPDKALQQRYRRTRHFKDLTEACVELYETCALCGRNDEQAGLAPHHRRYTTLFHEDLTRDVVLLCRRCHARHHRRR